MGETAWCTLSAHPRAIPLYPPFVLTFGTAGQVLVLAGVSLAITLASFALGTVMHL